MKPLFALLALTVLSAASAHAVARPGQPPEQTAAVGAHCDRLYEYGSPAWQACRRALMADASSLICGREPQLDVCKKGQQLLSAAEQTEVIASASLICGREPQLSICRRGQQILSAADPSLICGYEPQLSICKRGGAQLSSAGQPAAPAAAALPRVAELALPAHAAISFDGERVTD
ncbi:MAG: hypothetical protein SF051_04445 [Elusimicrobiota bacterium]|nr:hypothetical protein [Elusimicrobiota bacterium]